MLVLNAQGFLRHKEDIEIIINKYKPEVVCLTETHIVEEINDFEIKIRNYRVVRCNTENRLTGGVLTYIRQNIQYEEIINKAIENNVWISIIKVTGRLESITIGNVYHSPSTSDGRFIEIIVEECEKVLDMGRIIMVGDFNIDVSKKNDYVKRLQSNMSFLGFKQYVTEPTRITETSETIIDLVYSNFYIDTTVLLTPKVTDHQIVRLDLENYANENEKLEIYTRDYTNMRQEIFIERLTTKLDQMKDVINNDNTNIASDGLITGIINTIEDIAPVKKKIIKTQWQNKPWINTKTRNASMNRDRAYRQAKTTKRSEDWELYKQYRNLAVQELRYSKKMYYENNIDELKYDPKKMWKTIKEMIGTKKQDKSTDCITFNGMKYNDTKEIAEKFNEFFIKSIEEIVGEIDITVLDKVNEGNLETKFSKFRKVEYKDVNEVIKNLQNKKGTEEGITSEIMKWTWKAASGSILTVINKSLEEGIFPEKWKISTVVPIQKIHGSCKAEQYRPINVLPIYEKVLETIVKEQLLEFLERNNVLIEEQSGFRQGLSCETAIQKTLIEWRAYMDKSEMIGVVFIDFKRAFETVNRAVLIRKLREYGIGGGVIHWFESYLSNRKQKVKYKQTQSEDKENNYGVPQGTVLGPLLFIIYINDIVKTLKYGTCNLFADDMILYVNSDDADEIEYKINMDLKEISKWLKQNSLKLNVNKTNFMLIRDSHKRISTNRCRISIEDEKIEEVEETKYLGVIIDENLSFNSHVQYVNRKIAKKVNFLYRINKYISPYTRVTIYKTIIAPHFEYCNSTMLNYNGYSMESLQKVQNRAMRAILRCNRYTPICNMLDATGFMSVNQRMVFNVCIMVYKMVNGIGPGYLNREVKRVSDRHGYETRNANSLDVSKCRTKLCEKSIKYVGFKMYNNLPAAVRAQTTVISFKRELCKYVKDAVSVYAESGNG